MHLFDGYQRGLLVQPLAALGEITAPTLLVHGTKDTFVPVEDSRAAAHLFTAEHRLVEIEGSQHGFAVHDDPQYLNPQSQAWQALVIETVAEWITASSSARLSSVQAAPGGCSRDPVPRPRRREASWSARSWSRMPR